MSSQHRQRVRRCGEGLAEGRLRVLALSRFVHRHLHAVRVRDVGRCERPSRQPAGKRSRAGARGVYKSRYLFWRCTFEEGVVVFLVQLCFLYST